MTCFGSTSNESFLLDLTDGISHTWTHPPRNRKKTNHLKTDGKPSLRSAISSIWGPKSLEGLIPIDLTLKVQTDKMMARREGIDIV